MKRYKILFLVALAAVATSCQKDFLDRYPQTSVTPEVFFNTEEDLALYINGMLSLSGHGMYLSDQSTDNLATTAAVEVKNIMTGDPSSQNISGGWSWGRLRTINYFLENYDRAAVTDDVKNHYAGLARYYRAIFYHDKVKRFSDVPWYSGTLNPGDEELFKAQDPRELVMGNVMADLEFAMANVRDDVPTGTPDRWAVATMAAKIALYEGTYRKYHPELGLQGTADAFLVRAVAITEQIIAEGGFSIHNTGNPESDYADLFGNQDLTGNSEMILVNSYDQTKNRSGNQNTGIFGNYEQSPARDLVQAYLRTDGSRFTDQSAYETLGFVKEFENRDPRLAQTIAYPGWQRAQDSAPYVQFLARNFTGYHQLKGYANSTDQVILNSTDVPVHRYAEVLLILAEAKAELGTLTQTDLDNTVNLLRDRVAMPHLNLAASNADPDPVLVAKFADVVGANQGVILEIRRERRVELVFENSRYDDLMRWHAGKLLENIPVGMYFPGVGDYDLTGDDVPDIRLIPEGQTIPAEREQNSLGVQLAYYSIGTIGGGASIYLENGVNGGVLVTDDRERTFMEPKYYYRPVPNAETILNPNLYQLFDWE
ncbi:RagB/SusD family nutrient uptake outer membrane protein [Parapedobacter sp. 10938]|uniref:RagB/SusD family nutrient uptake outer membrane protein n=1 Tax=Parapedobacter flavus TaxID=3110225 RepID=UPI002DBC123D|nr:RagB/SusD family nutrient uptake outer membrane protein [Parapedobacter sp. 10938]MEC3879573.1 RagB/SusD family nutrient uptake outer membrane protein [Parapedobacter sp. 10938]